MKKIFLVIAFLLSIQLQAQATLVIDGIDFDGIDVNHTEPPPGPLRLLPLGDSITYGQTDSPIFGYRDHLQNLLGLGVYDFRGPYTDPNSSGTYDVDHAGVSGQTTAQILARLPGHLTGYMATPNDQNSAVLIHAGTNDCNLDLNLTTAVDNVEAMVDAIHAHDQFIRIYVALIIPYNGNNPTTGVTTDANIDTFNGLLASRMQTKQGTISNLHIVDMNAAFGGAWSSGLYSDAAHPKNAGYSLLADTWYACMTNPSSQYCDGH